VKHINLDQDWFDKLLPEGFPYPSSTLLTGPGGSGKPLIGNVIAASWLRQGGSVVFISLQYPDHGFIAAGLQRVSHLDLESFQDHIVFIELDATLDSMTPAEGNHFRANLVKPEVWDSAIEKACQKVPDEGPGVMVFVSALNLLLFSPTYHQEILEKMKIAAQGDPKRSYLFSASTTAKGEQIAELEDVVGNLIATHSTRSPFKLFMQIKRISGLKFVADQVEVPFPPELLNEMKEIADHSRKKVIPLVSQL